MTYLSHPYMTEVHLAQQRHQLATDAERDRITHDTHDSPTGATGRRPRASRGRPRLSLWTRLKLAAAR